MFKIDQIALYVSPAKRAEALALLEVLGFNFSVHDRVTAAGRVFGQDAENTALLAYDYTALEKAREFEMLTYIDGPSWIGNRSFPQASHIGMHVTEEELEMWRVKLAQFCSVVQEVNTTSHTNPAIAGKRSYHYVIFGTRYLIGVDLKFIIRKFL